MINLSVLMQVTKSFNDSPEATWTQSSMKHSCNDVGGRREDMSRFWDENHLEASIARYIDSVHGVGSKCGLNCVGRLENVLAVRSSY